MALQALLGARLAQLARSQFHRSAAGKGHELPGWLGVQAPHEVRVEERPIQTGHDGSRESPGQKLAGGLQHRRDADQVAKGLDHVGLQLVVESPVRPHPQAAVAVGLALEELHGLARANGRWRYNILVSLIYTELTVPMTPIMSVHWPRKLTLSLSSIQRLHCQDTQYWVDVNVTTLYCQLFLYIDTRVTGGRYKLVLSLSAIPFLHC